MEVKLLTSVDEPGYQQVCLKVHGSLPSQALYGAVI